MNTSFESSELIILKDEHWLKRQKHAGRCVSNVLKECGDLILNNTPHLNLLDLEKLVYQYCNVYDATPTFLGYKGFPSACCISVNKAVVHGIVHDYELQPGDIVSVDLGATYEGAIADAARTWIYGKPKDPKHVDLLNVGYEALLLGQKQVKVGNRLGSIGNAIYKYVSNKGYGVITDYGGHGIDYNKPHSKPFVANKQHPDDGNVIVNGLSIAIEPMVVFGEAKTKVDSDGWTVRTPELSCHYENSVTVFDNKVHIITESPYEGKWSCE